MLKENNTFLSEKNRNLLLFLAMVLIFLLRIPGLYQPILDIDESVFSEFANIMLRGGLPYVDAVDNKPPLMYAFFHWIYYLAGAGNLLMVHFITTILVMATSLLIYATARFFSPFRDAFIAVLFFIFITHIHEPKYISTNGETLINFLLMSSIFFYLKNRISGFSWFRAAAAGLFLGVAVLTNYKAGIAALVMIVDVFFLSPPAAPSGRTTGFTPGKLTNLCITGLFSMLPVALLLLYYLQRGNLPEFLYWGFTYNFEYISSGSAAFSILRPAGRTLIFFIMTAPLVFLLIRAAATTGREIIQKKQDGYHLHFFFVLFLFSMAAVLQGGRCYSHYYIQLAPPMALLSAPLYGLYTIKNPGRGKLFWSLLLVPVLLFTGARINIESTYKLINYPNWKADPALAEAGRYIKGNSSPGDTLYTWGWSTPLYFYAERPAASRFLISDFISGRIFGTGNRSKKRIIKEHNSAMMDILMEDLQKNMPLYFADTSPAGFFGYDRFPVSGYPVLSRFLQKNYSMETTIHGIVIYRRKSR